MTTSKDNGHTHTWDKGDSKTSFDQGHSHLIPPGAKEGMETGVINNHKHTL